MLTGIIHIEIRDYYEVSSVVRHKQINVHVCHRIRQTTRTVIKMQQQDTTQQILLITSTTNMTVWSAFTTPSYCWSLTIDGLLMMKISTCTEGNNKLVSSHPQTTSCKFKNVKGSVLWTCLRTQCFPSTAQRPSVNLHVCYCLPLCKLISFSHFEFL